MSYSYHILAQLLKDAETVDKELPEFVKALQKGEGAISSIESQFFQQVWFGDMYDGKEGIRGLQELSSELKRQLKLVNEKHVIDTLVKKFKNSKTLTSQEGPKERWNFFGF